MSTAPSLHPENVVAIHTADDAKLASFLKLASRLGWQITSMDELGIQLRFGKKYGTGYLLVGVATAIFGIGILILLIGLVDHAISRDRFLYVPRRDIVGGDSLRTADLLI